MCSHYQATTDRDRFMRRFGVALPEANGKTDIWPGTRGLMLRRPRARDAGDDAVPPLEALAGVFGLIPHWARDAKLSRQKVVKVRKTLENRTLCSSCYLRRR